MRIRIISKVLIIISLLLIITLVSCSSNKPSDSGNNNSGNQEQNGDTGGGEGNTNTITVTTKSYKILEGTDNETTAYTFSSSKPGPRVFIMGGTHGDELAGWNAALKLVEKKDWQGEIMLIPQCNILGCQREERYPGIKSGGPVNGVQYHDLNRNFPGKSDGTATEKIAYAIITELTKFNPQYAIDLHESRSTASEGRVGETLIYGNIKSALFADDIISDFNNNCLKLGENSFCAETNAPLGSFNRYCGVDLGIESFTIETTRTLDLNRRIEQQLQLLDIFFGYIWN